MKKGIRVILSLLMVVSMMGMNVNAIYAINNEESNQGERGIVDSGTCGEKSTWILYDDGELVIGGTGPIDDAPPTSPFQTQPWTKHRDLVKKVTIGHGITRIGEWGFLSFKNATSVSISDTVETIGNGAFAGWTQLTKVTLPDSVVEVDGDTFSNCVNLVDVKLS